MLENTSYLQSYQNQDAFQNLPCELYCHIFSFLPLASLTSAKRVNKLWSQMVELPDFEEIKSQALLLISTASELKTYSTRAEGKEVIPHNERVMEEVKKINQWILSTLRRPFMSKIEDIKFIMPPEVYEQIPEVPRIIDRSIGQARNVKLEDFPEDFPIVKGIEKNNFPYMAFRLRYTLTESRPIAQLYVEGPHDFFSFNFSDIAGYGATLAVAYRGQEFW